MNFQCSWFIAIKAGKNSNLARTMFCEIGEIVAFASKYGAKGSAFVPDVTNASQLCDKRICPVTNTLAERDGYEGNIEQPEDLRFLGFFLFRLLSYILEVYFRNNAPAYACWRNASASSGRSIPQSCAPRDRWRKDSENQSRGEKKR